MVSQSVTPMHHVTIVVAPLRLAVCYPVAVVATLSKGYDLNYIWKQVDRGPVKDAAGYYLQASENGGEPPGRRWGPGAKALGLEPGQVVDRETAARAHAWLARAGYLVTVPGVGLVVTPANRWPEEAI